MSNQQIQPKQYAGTMKKLPRLSKESKLKIRKRPLTRRQAPSSSKHHIVYVSSRTPLMAAINRVRKTLDRAHLAHQNNGTGPKHASLATRIESLERGTGAGGGRDSEVKVMGTGKAVQKVLAVASWFEQEGDCVVELRTGTVGAVDDVVAEEEDDGEEGEEEESRVRKMSCLEVLVKLK